MALEGAQGKRIRARHDGFTAAKQKKFLTWLGKTGCLKDAAGKAGVSTNTVRRHRDLAEDFEAKVQAALTLAAPELEAIAYKRATEGVEETVIRDGKVVGVRVKPSDSILRLLLQGANPKKYGRMGPAAGRKAKAREREADSLPPIEEVRARVLRKLELVRERLKRDEGYTEGPDDTLVPPGWRMVPCGEAAAAAGDGADGGGAEGAGA
jgi:hypothetical protein